MNHSIQSSAGALLLALCTIASAETEVSGNVALVTDYRFRGVTQSDRDGAIQGGFDVAINNGLYVGTWASSVSFGGSIEMDYYAGFSNDLNDDLSYDVSYVFYNYPSDNSTPDLDYQELIAKVSFADATAGVIFSNDWFAETDTYWGLFADYSIGLAQGVSLDLHAGYSRIDSAFFKKTDGFGVVIDREDSYVDWSASITKSLGSVDLSAAYVDTNIGGGFCGDDCDATLVLTISKSL